MWNRVRIVDGGMATQLEVGGWEPENGGHRCRLTAVAPGDGSPTMATMRISGVRLVDPLVGKIADRWDDAVQIAGNLLGSSFKTRGFAELLTDALHRRVPKTWRARVELELTFPGGNVRRAVAENAPLTGPSRAEFVCDIDTPDGRSGLRVELWSEEYEKYGEYGE